LHASGLPSNAFTTKSTPTTQPQPPPKPSEPRRKTPAALQRRKTQGNIFEFNQSILKIFYSESRREMMKKLPNKALKPGEVVLPVAGSFVRLFVDFFLFSN
jgi:hypothetical protein